MRITYGANDHTIDVTELCETKLRYKDHIRIPAGEFSRTILFTKPVPDVWNYIYVTDEDSNTTEHDHMSTVTIDIATKKVVESEREQQIAKRLREIHAKITIQHGSMEEEVPEQKMALQYLRGDETILEIGGNIGRNSLLLSSILTDDTRLVVVESDPTIANQLQENRDANNRTFHIEHAAISLRPLIQKGWNTVVSEEVLPGFHTVPTITYKQLQDKYKLSFDTLVLDCEGAFFYILQDMPEILDDIQLILMENDYWDITQKRYIDTVLQEHAFEVVYSEPGGCGPCFDMFYEVWKRSTA
jgi:FkbM family methyltransferase